MLAHLLPLRENRQLWGVVDRPLDYILGGSVYSVLRWILLLLTKDLPGYYFDPEKNRYFRLLPGHNNCNPLTKESIQQKEMEHKRLQLLEEEDKQKKVGSTFLGAALPLHSCQPPSTAEIRCQLNAPLRLNTVHFREWCFSWQEPEEENKNKQEIFSHPTFPIS